MKSYGPLPLINIANYKLIDTQIKAIQQTFVNFEIILCVGFDSEKICKYVRSKYNKLPIRIVENQLFNTSNNCESARLAINNTLNNKILICDGTLMFTNKTLSLINYDKACAVYEESPSENLEIGINVDDKNEAQHFSFGAHLTWSEILFLHNEEIIESFRKALSFQDSKNKFLFEAINELIKTKYKIQCIKNKHSIQRISNIKTYHSIKDSR
jgi:choline kinase